MDNQIQETQLPECLVNCSSPNILMYEMPTDIAILQKIREVYRTDTSEILTEVWISTPPQIGCISLTNPRRIFICILPAVTRLNASEWNKCVGVIHTVLLPAAPDRYDGFAVIKSRKSLSTDTRVEGLQILEAYHYKNPNKPTLAKQLCVPSTVKQLPARYAVKLETICPKLRKSFNGIMGDRLFESQFPTVTIRLIKETGGRVSFQFDLTQQGIEIRVMSKDETSGAINEVIEVLKDQLIELVDRVACCNVGNS